LIPVPLIDLKFLKELAAGGEGTSDRRHWFRAKFLPHQSFAAFSASYHHVSGIPRENPGFLGGNPNTSQ
jgi:hypothetical protein